MKKRQSGILLPISGLPGKYGIGDFGRAAYDFVDFLEKSKQKNWQILPLGVTSYGDSPYQCISSYAGNPYFIDLDDLIKDGYLSKETIDKFDLGDNPNKIDYAKLYINKYKLLEIAYENAKEDLKEDLEVFYIAHEYWLREFALFMAIKKAHKDRPWQEWDPIYKDYNNKEVRDFERDNKDSIYFFVFTQFYFIKQWDKLKAYANKKDIKIIGDLPIYVASDSSDVWAQPSLFKLDKNFYPISVAGVPNDDFSPKGQLWGNPIYDWEAIKEDDYRFWVNRIRYSFYLYDTLRIDHFRGFEAYWEIPFESLTATKGRWVKGPDIDLFNKIREELGDLDIIAEDLGFQTQAVLDLIENTGFPGMKILQFAFDPLGDSDNLPHNYINNLVVYTGTHDNQTIRAWYETVPELEKQFLHDYLKFEPEDANWALIRAIWSSVAYLSIAQLQDFLNLSSQARMNTPATLGGNWVWRYKKEDLSKELSDKIKDITVTYRRV